MAQSQHLIWTALPVGVRKDGARTYLRLTALVTPRLTGDAQRTSLSAFPDFWTSPADNWASRVAGATWQVNLSTAGGSGWSAPATPVGTRPDATLWGRLFNANTFVRSFPSDFVASLERYKVRPVLSYSVRHAVSGVERQFAAVGKIPSITMKTPQLRQMTDPRVSPVPLLKTIGDTSRLESLAPLVRPSSQVRTMAAEDPAVLAFADYHRAAAGSGISWRGAGLTPDDFDFHQATSFMSNQPALLRALGLAVDLEFELTTAAFDAARIAVAPTLPAPAAVIGLTRLDTLLTTNYAVDRAKGTFVAQSDPANPKHKDGMLLLRSASGAAPFVGGNVDVDHAVSSLLAESRSNAARPATDAVALPALRTAGPWVAKAGREADFRARLERKAKVNAAIAARQTIDLYAEDLVQGYRVDVHAQDTGRWYPLCAMESHYTVADAAVEAWGESSWSTDPDGKDWHREEGFVEWANSSASAKPAEDIASLAAWAEQEAARLLGETPDLEQALDSYLTYRGVSGGIRAKIAAGLDGAVPAFQAITRSPSAQLETLTAAAIQNYDAGVLRLLRDALAAQASVLGLRPLEPALRGLIEMLRSARDLLTTIATEAVRLQEALFEWRGWSLVAPPPGKAIQPGADAEGNTILGYGKGTFRHPSFPLHVQRRVPAGTLPRLRFGKTYRFRARAVDMAGNSVSFAEAPSDLGSLAVGEPIHHGRLEPVLPPVILPQWPHSPTSTYGDGEHALRIVLRSDFDTPASSVGTQDRVIAPPRVSVKQAEEMGVMDTGGIDGQAVTPRFHAELDARDRYHVPADDRGDSKPITIGEVRPAPWLPDPLAAGASFIGLPGTPTLAGTQALRGGGAFLGIKAENAELGTYDTTTAVTVPYYNWGEWWWKGGVILRVKGIESSDPRVPAHATPAAPDWNPDSGVLTVEVPKGEEVTVKVSSYVPEVMQEKLGIVRLLETDLASSVAGASLLRKLRTQVKMGAHWMVTPSAELTITHAVRRPLIAPDFAGATIVRGLGDTSAILLDHMPIHGPSTGRVEVIGSWNEWIDEPEKGTPEFPAPAPATAVRETPAFGVDVPEHAPVILNAVTEGDRRNQRHHFGDTKHRLVTYRATAVSRYVDCFPRFGGTRVDEPQAASDLARESTRTVQLHVPSSARPPAPRVAYVVPAFETTETAGAKTRVGGRLRVYLERPWYASGEGELLGVVTVPSRVISATAAARLAEYASDWGDDPLFRTGATTPSDRLAVEHLLGAQESTLVELAEVPAKYVPPVLINSAEADGGERDASAQGILPPLPPIPDSISELRDLAVANVTGYAVAYDSFLDMWYADVRIDASAAYRPFVKLALVRFQPHSLRGVEVSPVTRADFVQLAPERTASVVYRAPVLIGQPGSYDVTVAGPAYAASSLEVESPQSPRALPVLTLQVQRATGTTPAEPAWEPWGDEIALAGSSVSAGIMRWSATLTEPTRVSGTRCRLLVREYETFASGFEPVVDGTTVTGMVPLEQRRLVYAEVLDLW